MTIYIVLSLAAALVFLLGYVSHLQLRLYAQAVVAAIYRASEDFAMETEHDLVWLRKDASAYDIKKCYVFNAYRRMPTHIGFLPASVVRALYGEQRYMDLVEREFEHSRRLAGVVEQKDQVSIDLM